VPTLFGFAVILVLLLVAVQVSFDLYARSAVTGAAVDAARTVADFDPAAPFGSRSLAGAEAEAEAHARAELGAFGHPGVTSFAWSTAGGAVVLTVGFDITRSHYAVAGALLPGLNRFHRTIRVRIEHFACPASGCSVVPGTGLGGT
jgi:hypothetical protein